MECVILLREHSGYVGYISDEHDESRLAIFGSREAAEDFADNSRYLQSVCYQIVEISGL